MKPNRISQVLDSIGDTPYQVEEGKSNGPTRQLVSSR